MHFFIRSSVIAPVSWSRPSEFMVGRSPATHTPTGARADNVVRAINRPVDMSVIRQRGVAHQSASAYRELLRRALVDIFADNSRALRHEERLHAHEGIPGTMPTFSGFAIAAFLISRSPLDAACQQTLKKVRTQIKVALEKRGDALAGSSRKISERLDRLANGCGDVLSGAADWLHDRILREGLPTAAAITTDSFPSERAALHAATWGNGTDADKAGILSRLDRACELKGWRGVYQFSRELLALLDERPCKVPEREPVQASPVALAGKPVPPSAIPRSGIEAAVYSFDPAVGGIYINASPRIYNWSGTTGVLPDGDANAGVFWPASAPPAYCE